MTEQLYADAIKRLTELRREIDTKNAHIGDLQKALRDEQARSERYKSIIVQSVDSIERIAGMPNTLALDYTDKLLQILRSVK